ncbi:MAG: helix-turn-helix domain-containing protein [Clostridia bacterium]|nr:helix-turn-helix transcriptional regulator [Clostridium sp.]
MKLSDAIRKRIEFYLKEKNMNVWKLCKMSGIPCSTISTFMSGKTELIKLDTLLHICEGFEITLGEFFTDSIFDIAEQD